MSKDLEARVASLEKEVTAIKRVRMVAANLAAQAAEDEINARLMKPGGGKAVRPQSDKAVRAREDK